MPGRSDTPLMRVVQKRPVSATRKTKRSVSATKKTKRSSSATRTQTKGNPFLIVQREAIRLNKNKFTYTNKEGKTYEYVKMGTPGTNTKATNTPMYRKGKRVKGK